MTRKRLLTPHFSVNEMTRSRTARQRGIDNTPSPRQLKSLKRMAEWLELVRLKIGKPIRVTSGFRGKELNKAIGGASRSFHTRGLAADLQVKGMTNQELAIVCASVGLPDLIIEETLKRRRPWVHAQIEALGKTPRGKCLLARTINGKTKYLPCGPDFENPNQKEN